MEALHFTMFVMFVPGGNNWENYNMSCYIIFPAANRRRNYSLEYGNSKLMHCALLTMLLNLGSKRSSCSLYLGSLGGCGTS